MALLRSMLESWQDVFSGSDAANPGCPTPLLGSTLGFTRLEHLAVTGCLAALTALCLPTLAGRTTPRSQRVVCVVCVNSVSGSGGSFGPVFRADGQHIAFISHASNLVTILSDGRRDLSLVTSAATNREGQYRAVMVWNG